MSTDFNSDVTTLKTNEAKLLDSRAKVARFCYEEQALEGNTDADVFGVNAYNYNNAQNIPYGSPTILQMSETVLSKGLRSQGSSFTRMGVNHFWGRASYNINKLAKHLNDLITYFKDFLREGSNAWSPTATYVAGDIVYFMSTVDGFTSKRVFECTLTCTNLPPLDAYGHLSNPTNWKEISGNFAGHLVVQGEGKFENDVQLEKNLNVKGDLIVEGSTLITDEQTVSTSSDYAILRHNNPSPLASAEKAGMVIHNYDTNKNAFIGVGNDGTFRVSDNASETETAYTNISKFGANYFTGLTQTSATVVGGAVVSEDVDELENTVLNNATYYHNLNGQWFAVSLSDDALYFDETSPVEDPSLIAVLEASTKYVLLYYRSFTVLIVSDTENQPLLTRQEEADLANDDILRWDATNRRAKGGLTVADIVATSLTYKYVSSRTFTGAQLSSGGVMSLYFTADINGSSIDTKLTFNYNGTDYAVKIPKGGALADFDAVLDNGTYKFIQAYTAITVMFDGTYMVVLENPIVLTVEGNDIRADGTLARDAVGTVKEYWGDTDPIGAFICDGRDTTGTADELETVHPWLYKKLGNSNVLPDLRECTIVGIGRNGGTNKNTTHVFDSTETNPSTGLAGTQNHDEYTLGQFKDDQIQSHTHPQNAPLKASHNVSAPMVTWENRGGEQPAFGRAVNSEERSYTTRIFTDVNRGRSGTTTHGKQIGMSYIITY